MPSKRSPRSAQAQQPVPVVRRSILARVVRESLLVSCISIVLLSSLTFVIAQSFLRQRVFDQVLSMASAREDLVEEAMRLYRERTTLLASGPEIRQFLVGEKAGLQALLDRLLTEQLPVLGVTVIDAEPTVAGSVGIRSPVPLQRLEATDTVPFIDRKHGWHGTDIYSPLRTGSGAKKGLLAVRFNVTPVLTRLFKDLALGKTGEVDLGMEQGGEIFIVHHSLEAEPIHTYPIGSISREHIAKTPIALAVQGGEGVMQGRDEKGKRIIAAYRFLPSLGWGMVVKVQTADALAGVWHLAGFLGLIGLFLLFLSAVIGIFFSRRLISPILKLAERMRSLKPGQACGRSIRTGDELEVLDHVFTDLSNRLKATYDHLEDEVASRTAELRRQYALDRAVLGSIPYGVLTVDPGGLITDLNPAAAKLFFSPGEDVVGKSATDFLLLRQEKGLIDAADHPLARCLRERSHFRSTPAMHLNLVRKDQNLLPVMLSVTPLLQEEKLLGAIVVFVDMTEERQTDYMKTEFISLTSHQLRTPLSSVQWYLELLATEKTPKLSEAQQSYIDEISVAIQRMTTMLETLLRVAKLDEGGIAIQKENVNIIHSLQQLFHEFRKEAKEASIECSIALPKHAVKIHTDPVLLGIVLQNLFTNAVKYSPKGRVEVLLMPKKDHLEISVKDNGLGIPKKDQSRVFQKFFRSQNVRQVKVNGTGLGLFISKTIVDALGGKIWFESEEGKGTTFSISLPVEK